MLGLTATPERGDGTGLAPLFTSLVVGVTVRALTTAGHLVPCEVIRPERWLKEGGAPGNPLAQRPLDAWRAHGMNGREARQGFLFCASVEEAETFAREFCDAGIRAVAISANTHADERAAALDAFRAGTVRVLVNVFVFTEGTDLPMAEVCCLASSPGTAGGYLQRVGRVLRTSPGKTGALLIDLPGISHLHGMPEDERVYKLTGKGIVVAGRVCKVCGSPVDEYPCAACGYMPEPTEPGGVGESEITNDPLVKFARKIAEGPQQRWETLIRWLRAARLKGHNPRSVRHKWRHVYREELPAQDFQAACVEVFGGN